MGHVSDFEQELSRRANMGFGRWFEVDLHNHTPTSGDYRGKAADLAEKTAQRIREHDISVVMFTDHEKLPDPTFIGTVQTHTQGRLLLRGVELNVFVDAFDVRHGKVDKEVFYHLLLGFDPDGINSPEYWLEHLYRECRAEARTSGNATLFGIPASPAEIADVLADSNAIIIPAHLHRLDDPTSTRSVDDIYGDRTFLIDAANAFTALEVVDPRTAAFFDGLHAETDNLLKSCVRSSDSHEPDEIGRRVTWLEMEEPSYAELKAALELPFRTSLVPPSEPPGYVVGMHIRGTFFPDQWIAFSRHCNMLIAVKGSGKTSVLECLRFALGSDVPASKADSVTQHLGAILGTGGQVQVLVKRPDGARVLVERKNGETQLLVTFEDDRRERFTTADALAFPTHILGWNEIEQAATDPLIRRVYMDSIAGKSQVRAFEEEAKALGTRIRERHTSACQRYAVYRDISRQVDSLQELRKGLQALTDAKLFELRTALQAATEQREAVQRTVARLRDARTTVPENLRRMFESQERSLKTTDSVLAGPLTRIDEALDRFFVALDATASAAEAAVGTAEDEITAELSAVEEAHAQFLAEYQQQVAQLPPDQQRLLESHREVLERTKELGSLEGEKAVLKAELTGSLGELADLCDRLAKALDGRTSLRREAVGRLNASLAAYDVHISLAEQQRSSEFEQLSSRYGQGAGRLNTLGQRLPARLASLCLKSAYGKFAGDFDWELGDILFDSDIGYFVSAFENDDLQIALKVGKVGEEFSPIDKLSAGQRCTAMFPILLEIGQGVLVVDQPEDNLDNRHIAAIIAPALLAGKMRRQMIFTSHNANLVVLSDAEAIMMFESDGVTGRVEEQGFFATSRSKIAQHVLEVLDGGPKALAMRTVKYGLGTRS